MAIAANPATPIVAAGGSEKELPDPLPIIAAIDRDSYYVVPCKELPLFKADGKADGNASYLAKLAVELHLQDPAKVALGDLTTDGKVRGFQVLETSHPSVQAMAAFLTAAAKAAGMQNGAIRKAVLEVLSVAGVKAADLDRTDAYVPVVRPYGPRSVHAGSYEAAKAAKAARK